jgi:TIGR03009 family protein
MRRSSLALAAVVLAAGAAGAQQQAAPPAAPPAAPGADAALDRYLLRWEQEMQRIQSLAAVLQLKEHDKTFDTKQEYAGFAQYMKAGAGPTAQNLGMLELRPLGKGGAVKNEVSHKFICTGAHIYQFLPAQKEIKAYEIPRPPAGQVADDNFLSFLFGMKAAQARARYDLKLSKEDQWYIYVDIVPRTPRDRAEFRRAQIVLNRDSFLPRRLWFEQPNGSEVLWDIPQIQAGARVNRADFDPPKAPPGWKLTHVPRNADLEPRVIRSGQ